MKINQKGFVNIILIGIIIIILGVVGYIFIQKQGDIILPYFLASIGSDDVINNFVKSADFPKSQRVNILVNVPTQNLKVFKINYGEARDCPAGCFFSRATGIKYGSKIGWISINDYDDINVSKLVMYDFDASDTYFYTDKFFQLLISKNNRRYLYPFFTKLAEDKDVPIQVKEKIKNALSPVP